MSTRSLMSNIMVLVCIVMMCVFLVTSTTPPPTSPQTNNHCLFNHISSFPSLISGKNTEDLSIDFSALQLEDFTVLVSRSSQIPPDSDKFTYSFDFCGVSRDLNCAAHLDSSLCQYWDKTGGIPNDFAKSIGSWVAEPRPQVEALFKQSTITTSTIEDEWSLDGYRITFKNGDDGCWLSPQEPAVMRTTTLHILCPSASEDPTSGNNNKIIQLMEEPRCTYNATLYHPIACPQVEPEPEPINYCLFDHLENDLSIDFSPLKNQDFTVSVSRSSQIPSTADHFSYSFDFCGVSRDLNCAAHLDSSLCQYWDKTGGIPNDFAKSIGSWVAEPRPQVQALYNDLQTDGSSLEQLLNGYLVTFKNGDGGCWVSPQSSVMRTTNLHILCPLEGNTNPTNVIELMEVPGCIYNATLYHPIACPQVEPEPQPEPDFDPFYCQFPEVGLDLNLILANTTIALPSRDDPSHYFYTMTFCGYSPEPACRDSKRAFCQYDYTQGSQLIRSTAGWDALPPPIVRYENSTEIIDPWDQYMNSTGRFVFEFHNGGDYCWAGFEILPPTTVLYLSCGAIDTQRFVIEPEPCRYEVHMSHPSVCSITPPEPEPEPQPEPDFDPFYCQFPEVGLDLNLILANTTIALPSRDDPSHYFYTMTFCGYSPEPACRDSKRAFCQYDYTQGSQLIRSTAGWDALPPPIVRYENSTEIIDPWDQYMNSTGRFVFEFHNGGDYCWAGFEILPPTTVLYLSCGAIDTQRFVIEPEPCRYEVHMSHPSVCSITPPEPEPEPQPEPDFDPFYCQFPEVGLDLNLILANTTIALPSRDDPSHYFYTMTFCGYSPEPACRDSKRAFCQYDYTQGSQLIRSTAGWDALPPPIVRYENSTEIIDPWDQYMNSTGRFVFEFHNGGDYCWAGFEILPPTTVLYLSCGAIDTQRFVIEPEPCRYEVHMSHPSVCSITPPEPEPEPQPEPDFDPFYCQFPEVGLDLNLILANTTIALPSRDDPSHYFYTMTFCGYSPEPACRDSKRAFCQYDYTQGSQLIRSTAGWDALPPPIVRYENSTEIIDPWDQYMNSTGRFVFEFHNGGDYCWAGFEILPPTTVLYLSCGAIDTQRFVIEPEPCRYEVHMSHPSVCSITPPEPEPEPQPEPDFDPFYCQFPEVGLDLNLILANTTIALPSRDDPSHYFYTMTFCGYSPEPACRDSKRAFCQYDYTQGSQLIRSTAGWDALPPPIVRYENSTEIIDPWDQYMNSTGRFVFEFHNGGDYCWAGFEILPPTTVLYLSCGAIDTQRFVIEPEPCRYEVHMSHPSVCSITPPEPEPEPQPEPDFDPFYCQFPEVGLDLNLILANTTIALPSRDDPSHYFYTMTFCGYSPEPACRDSKRAFCQYDYTQGSQLIRSTAGWDALPPPIVRYENSTEIIDPWDQYMNSTGRFVFEFHNGGDYCWAGFEILPPTTVLYLSCGAIDTQRFVIEPEPCRYEVHMSHPSVCSITPPEPEPEPQPEPDFDPFYCQFPEVGLDLNLILANTTIALPSRDDPSHYFYTMTFCGYSPEPACRDSKRAFCQYDYTQGSQLIRSTAGWDALPPPIVRYENSTEIIDPWDQYMNSTGRFVFEFHNGGDYCWAGFEILPPTTVLYLSCGAIDTQRFVIEPEPCRYEVHMSHPSVCSITPPEPEPEPQPEPDFDPFYCQFPEVGLDLNLILANTTIALPSRDDPSHYFYTMTFCGYSPEPACRDSKRAFCQYDYTQGSQLIRSTAGWDALPPPIVRYENSTEIIDPWDQYMNSTGRFVFEFHNGGDYCWAGFEILPPTTVLYLSCGAIDTQRFVIEPEPCRYEVHMSHPSVCSITPPEPEPEPQPEPDFDPFYCQFPEVGLDLNLILANTTIALPSRDDPSHYFYTMTFCGYSPEPACRDSKRAFCQYDYTQGSQLIRSTAGWDALPPPIVRYENSTEIIDPWDQYMNSTGRFVFEFHNGGDYCWAGFEILPPTTVLYLSCGAIDTQRFVIEPEPCRYEVHMSHPSVCSITPPEPEPEPQPEPDFDPFYCQFPEVGLDLNLILANTTIALPSRDDPSHYFYTMTFCGYSPEPACRDSKRAFCQYDYTQGSQLIRSTAGWDALPPPIVRYENSTEIIDPWDQYMNSTGRFVFEFHNGGDYCWAGFEILPPTTVLYLSCGAIDTQRFVIEPEPCRYEVHMSHPSVCSITPPEPEPEPQPEPDFDPFYCQFPEVGLDLNLILANTTIALPSRDDPSHYFYTMTFCGYSPEPACRDSKRAFCQYDYTQGSQLIRSTAGWDALPPPIVRYENSTEIIDPWDQYMNSTGRFVFEFHNGGDYCWAGFEILPPTTVLYLSCGAIDTQRFVIEPEPCRYEVHMSHPSVCSITPPEPEPEPQPEPDFDPFYCQFPEVGLDLNLILANTTIALPSRDDPSHYFYTMTFCGYSPEPSCRDSGMSFCQYDYIHGGEFIRGTAGWDALPGPTVVYDPTFVFNTTANGRYIFEFTTGPECYLAFSYVTPTTILYLNCGYGSEEPFAMETEACRYEVHMSHPSVCSAPPPDPKPEPETPIEPIDPRFCQFPEVNLNLNRYLGNVTIAIPSMDSSQYYYTMTFCDQSPELHCREAGMSFCQYDAAMGDEFIRGMVGWDRLTRPIVTFNNSTDPSQPGDLGQFIFQFESGTPCQSGFLSVQPTTTLYLGCGDGNLSSFATEVETCKYEVHVSHPAMCGVYDPDSVATPETPTPSKSDAFTLFPITTIGFITPMIVSILIITLF